jgi:hypothetical protein
MSHGLIEYVYIKALVIARRRLRVFPRLLEQNYLLLLIGMRLQAIGLA